MESKAPKAGSPVSRKAPARQITVFNLMEIYACISPLSAGLLIGGTKGGFAGICVGGLIGLGNGVLAFLVVCIALKKVLLHVEDNWKSPIWAELAILLLDFVAFVVVMASVILVFYLTAAAIGWLA